MLLTTLRRHHKFSETNEVQTASLDVVNDEDTFKDVSPKYVETVNC